MASAYNPAAIRRADLYKAAFPARFGGKTASVLDVQSVDADLQRCHGQAEVGLLSAKAALHLPLVTNPMGNNSTSDGSKTANATLVCPGNGSTIRIIGKRSTSTPINTPSITVAAWTT